jgi:hypothetical protein
VALDGETPLPIRLERKALGDLYSCFGFQRERFEAELKQLRGYDYRALIIEASLAELIAGYDRSHVTPRAALGSLCAWSVRFGLAIWFCENHAAAAAIAQRLLESFAIGELRRAVPHPSAKHHRKVARSYASLMR